MPVPGATQASPRIRALRDGALLASRVLGVWGALAFGLVAMAALSARFSFGHWPRVYRDDTSSLVVLGSGILAAYAILSSHILLPLASLTLVARGVLRIAPVIDRWVAAALLGSAAVIAFSWWDPFGYVEWLFD